MSAAAQSRRTATIGRLPSHSLLRTVGGLLKKERQDELKFGSEADSIDAPDPLLGVLCEFPRLAKLETPEVDPNGRQT